MIIMLLSYLFVNKLYFIIYITLSLTI
ncbi:Hypothetical protein FNO222_1441 [Francisella orientalis]|uniref:Uncharacterized protein n=1 Tax=Francisella orientalis TaxID=299583 RepID=A0ABM5U7N0_9GAMM|nr:hypothetical protein FNO12_1428 [Francisella orientalis FNO12]AKN87527.1 Hypothetical protein FNO24_1430 [Francisella orientalis FNO24]AKN89065.1 Hypothetical protein FNO190_1428 [Francisella orientalis]AKU05824.1 Hypothetical protein FNO01_1428 [Francisella orientalis]QEN20740.1 Hypothetical protein FNO39_1441 [Francisella orientalis]